MFRGINNPRRKLKLTKLAQHFQRYNSSKSTASTARKWSSSFDKSMYYPGFLLILLGSQIMNVMNAQRSVEDLERRYALKSQKLDDLTLRLKSGEVIDVDEELRLINRLFAKKGNSTILPDGKAEITVREDLEEEDLIKLLGLDEKVPATSKKQVKQVDSEPVVVIQDRDVLKDKAEQEKELLNYRLKPETHLIVEKPGEYIEAAKDTKVAKFL